MNERIKLGRYQFKTTAVMGFALTVVLAFCSLAEAQKFDIGDFLEKKDINRDGKIEEAEMSGNIKGILQKMDFDTSQPVSISKIVSKVNKDKKALAKGSEPGGSGKAERTRLVPGFGVEAAESLTVPRFGAANGFSRGKSAKFSDRVMERVASVLERYDRNKNGSLDQSEIKQVKWGSPSPGESDTNNDGTLSRNELAIRFAAREQYFRGADKTKSDGDDGKEKMKEPKKQTRRDRRWERFRNSRASSMSSSTGTTKSRIPASTSSGSSGSGAVDSRAKYQKYTDSLITSYDKDKDGRLSKDELKQMRRPPVGADVNKDGFVTRSELLNNLSGANKKTATKSAKPKPKAKKSAAKNNRNYQDNNAIEAARRGRPVDHGFDKLDSNLDQNIQMHEFSNEWDDKTVAEFYAKDKNGDGVITLDEWSARN